jgi:hypothetical protein
VLPLIVTAIILAVQNLKDMAEGGSKLVKWTIGYYVLTTIFAVVHSMILMDLVWSNLMVVADPESLQVDSDQQETIDENSGNAAHDIVVSVFTSFIPQNIVQAFAQDQLLSVLVTAIIVGCLLKRDSAILRAVKEIDKMVFVIISFLIKLAPIGVFFLILANLLTLPISDIGINLGVLLGSSIAGTCTAEALLLVSYTDCVSRHVHSPLHLPAHHLLLLHPREPLLHLGEVFSRLDYCMGLGFVGCYSASHYEMSEETEDRRARRSVHSSFGRPDQHGRNCNLRTCNHFLQMRIPY